MAKVQEVRELTHYPQYDAFLVKEDPEKTFKDFMTDPRMIRFFVDIQSKTKLETNLQASGVLPSLNSFEAHALRVVVSNLRFQRGYSRHDEKEGLLSNLNEGEILADLIYNSVISLIVGEKTMIEMPTFWFPAGAGVSPGFPNVASHGEPNPEATFRFAEPVRIDPQQSFRVELSFPQGVPAAKDAADKAAYRLRLGDVRGPFRIWVVLDGYLTRDVQ